MRIEFTERFRQSYRNAPDRVKKDFQKQGAFLIANRRHPSLRAKKYDETRNIWQARVNREWRFYFVIQDDVYRCLDLMAHPK